MHHRQEPTSRSFSAPIADRGRKHLGRRMVEGGAALGAIVLVLVLSVTTIPTGSTSPTSSRAKGSVLSSFTARGVSVSDSVLEAVGLTPGITLPKPATGRLLLTDRGKSAVVYVGANYCPFCAMQRWALVVALSRFGTFTKLGPVVSSSSTDAFPGLKSWSFHGSRYSSRYVTFDPAELYSSRPAVKRRGTSASFSDARLDRLSPLQRKAYGYHGISPFVNIANRFVMIGSMSSPQLIEGLPLDRIVADLSNPTSPVGQAIDGDANYLIAAICDVAGVHGARICSSSVIRKAQHVLKGMS